METTFEITSSAFQTNEKFIKRARRWIITTFVWGMIGSFFIGILIDHVEINAVLQPIGSNVLSILFVMAGLLPLRRHTSFRVRRFARILIFALCGNPILYLIHCLSLIIPGEYWGSIYRTIVEIFVTLVCGYLTCVGYAFLIRDERIESACRSTVLLLCKGIFISTIVTVSIGICFVSFEALNLSYTQIDSFSGILILLTWVQRFLFFVSYVIFIIGYKRLFATPSAFPAEDDDSAYISIWKPSRMSIGFLVSMLLFITLLYFMLRIVFFLQ